MTDTYTGHGSQKTKTGVGFHVRLNIIWCTYRKFMVCMSHILQRKTPHYTKHKFHMYLRQDVTIKKKTTV